MQACNSFYHEYHTSTSLFCILVFQMRNRARPKRVARSLDFPFGKELSTRSNPKGASEAQLIGGRPWLFLRGDSRGKEKPSPIFVNACSRVPKGTQQGFGGSWSCNSFMAGNREN